MKIAIQSNVRNYDVFFENNYIFLNELKKIKNAIFVIDKNVYELYENNFLDIQADDMFLFEAVEGNKTFDSVMSIYDFLMSRSVKRNWTLVSIGGGITQDISGFVASTLYRGINWVFVPTTFLAITDSCIGSKTSINYNSYKNLVGTFFPPNKIYINPNFLNTLSKVDFFSGIGEAIKFQLMKENYPKNFEYVKDVIDRIKNDPDSRLEIINDNLRVKLSYMEGDEFDLGRRNLLNYGHCFGHAVETSSNYYVPHGIAVMIGMIFANIISHNRGLLNNSDYLYVNNEILIPNIVLDLRESDFNDRILLDSMKNDKKRVGDYLSVIIPDSDFKMIKVDDITDDEFNKALCNLSDILFS